jgi:hypothetical protein
MSAMLKFDFLRKGPSDAKKIKGNITRILRPNDTKDMVLLKEFAGISNLNCKKNPKGRQAVVFYDFMSQPLLLRNTKKIGNLTFKEIPLKQQFVNVSLLYKCGGQWKFSKYLPE